MKTISLQPELNELYRLNDFIIDNLKEENLKLNLIAEEVFVNIVNYSNADFIKVNVEFETPTLTMEFIDNGIEFNPLLKEDPKAPETIEEAQIGGWGIFLAKEMADEIYYQHINGENHLKIIKKVE